MSLRSFQDVRFALSSPISVFNSDPNCISSFSAKFLGKHILEMMSMC